LKLAVEAVKILGIPSGLIINRSDMGDDKVLEYAQQEGLPILMEIPFDRKIAEAYPCGKPIVEIMPKWKNEFRTLYHRQETRKLAEAGGDDLILTDGPPGIGCPVIASIGGATALAIIVEPTVSGLHDMQRVAELAVHFKVPGLVCVNKYDLNMEMTEKIEAYSLERNMTLLGRILFDHVFTKAMIQGKNIIERAPDSLAAQSIREVWAKIMEFPSMNTIGLSDFTAIIQ
jgi:MinD superfamily P-loop ATPase